jgi:acetyl esterase/lipase
MAARPPPSRDTQVYATADGQPLWLDLIGAQPGQRRPALLWIHGGGLIFGSRRVSPRPAFLQALVDAGFVVASIDHRLAPETKLPAIADDVLQAWRWLHDAGVKQFGVDPARTAIAGASAGGYLALLTAARATPRPRAVTSFWGYGDILAPWETEPSAHYLQFDRVTREDAMASLAAPPVQDPAVGIDRSIFYLYCRQQGLWVPEVTGLDAVRDSAALQAWCPLRHVGPDFPPTLLLHGQDDLDVPHEQSELFAATLARAGVPHQWLSLPGTGHGFAGAQPQDVVAAESTVIEFLATQTARPTPA